TAKAVAVPGSAMGAERSRIVSKSPPPPYAEGRAPARVHPRWISCASAQERAQRDDDGAARDCKCFFAFRGRERAAGRQLRRGSGRARRDHRSEWRGKDEPPELHQRRLPPAARGRTLRRSRSDADEAI